MHIVLYDRAEWRVSLYPLTLTRPVADLRIGILTIAEKWGKWLNMSYSFLSMAYLSEKYPLGDIHGEVLLIKSNCCPDRRLCDAVSALKPGEVLVDDDDFIACYTDATALRDILPSNKMKGYLPVRYPHEVVKIANPEDIFQNNGVQIRSDFERLTAGRTSAELSESNRFIGDQIFVEEGAQAECATFNSTKGPIYLGKNSEVWEGSLIRGAFALGEGSQLKMGTRIYSNVTVGPYSRVGGELNTCVIWGRSSKGHDGYLGSAVMGEWCNWGADTNNSNMKNNYKSVRLYDYSRLDYRDTGLQFCGTIMGDHAKCAINTAFNTGTVVGVAASIFGAGVPPTYVPDFSWGGADGFKTYELNKLFETAELVFQRRDCEFDQKERDLLAAVFELTLDNRDF